MRNFIKSAFRPSDDSTTYQYFIPGNSMMQIEIKKSLGYLNKMNIIGYNSRIRALYDKVKVFKEQIKNAIYEYGVTKDSKGRDIFAYEVDCYGNNIKMDDANVPSLLSLSYLEFIDKNTEIYKNTREYVWSKSNPYFWKGSTGGYWRAAQRAE